MLVRMGLIKGLARSSHDGEESLLLSLRGSHNSLSHGRCVVLCPCSNDSMLLLDREVGGDVSHPKILNF
jgi:hypothetical protein